jgi:uridine kinase
MQHWVDQISARIKENGTGFTVGINGLDCSGKTTLAEALVAHLKDGGREAQLLHVDDFNNHQTQKKLYASYARGEFGVDEHEDYFQNSVCYDNLKDAILKAKQPGGIVVVEGVFLFKSSLKSLFNLKVLLKIPTALGRERYAHRRQVVGDERPVSVFSDIWVPAYNRYAAECDVEAVADLVFEQA